MNAKQIREERPSRSGIPNAMYQSNSLTERDFQGFVMEMLREGVAQLAEIAEHLKRFAYPSLVFDASNVDLKDVDLSGPSHPILRVTEPRATLRDQFAIAALSGMLADPNVTRKNVVQEAVEFAYKAADAMMEARKK